MPERIGRIDDGHLVSAGDDRTIRVWSADPNGTPEVILQGGYRGPVLCVAIAPDRKGFATGSGDGTIRFWSLESFQPMGQPIDAGQKSIRGLAYRGDGRRILSVGGDGTLRQWSTSTGRPLAGPFLGERFRITVAAYSPVSARIVSGDSEGQLQAWDADSGRPIGEPIPAHRTLDLAAIEFSRDGAWFASAGADGRIALWPSTPTRDSQRSFYRRASAEGISISTDGKRIASAGSGVLDAGGRTVEQWDVLSGAPVGTPREVHGESAMGISYSEDGRHLVSGGDDGKLQFWDSTHLQPVGKPIKEHLRGVTGVRFTGDGRWVVSSSEDGTVRVWPAPRAWPDLLCAKLTSNISRKEWAVQVSSEIE